VGEHRRRHEYANIGGIEINTADDPIFNTISVTIFFQGCNKKCEDCHNPQFQDKSLSAKTSMDFIYDFIDRRSEIVGSVVFCGGEPMLQKDIVLEIADTYFNKLKTILYTGFFYWQVPYYLCKRLDAVIAGPYDKTLHKDGAFPASSNQKVWWRDNGEWVQYKPNL
jgi:pyruvate-formate lyase-activating enzyme